jgi:hypothetical protein
MTESTMVVVLEEHGLEENSGSYDDYRDALNIFGIAHNPYESMETKQQIKKYLNIS